MIMMTLMIMKKMVVMMIMMLVILMIVMMMMRRLRIRISGNSVSNFVEVNETSTRLFNLRKFQNKLPNHSALT